MVNTPRRGLSPGAASTEGKRVITSQLPLPTGLTGLLLSIATKGRHGDEGGGFSLSVSPSSPSSSSALGNLIPARCSQHVGRVDVARTECVYGVVPRDSAGVAVKSRSTVGGSI